MATTDTDERMADYGLYRVLDADKRPICIGDKVDSDHHEDGTVTGVQFYAANGGIRTLVAVRPDGWDVATWHTPDEYHRHKPTVEDVLREFANECLTYATCVDDHEVTDAIELYAAKLRLAGDAE